MISLQRALQGIVLALFCLSIFGSSLTAWSWLETKYFVNLDPLLYLAGILSTGILLPGLVVFLILLLSSLLLGRFFCGYLCPLGTSFDLVHRLFPASKVPANKFRIDPGWKYSLLLLILLSAILGINLSHWGSPLSLAARLYSLLLEPIFLFTLHSADKRICSGECIGLPAPFKFQGIIILSLLFIFLFFLNQKSNRFWCRFLCPVGGLLALLANFSPVYRIVSDKCNNCGICQKNCPMQAILENPKQTDFNQCILCHKCLRVCPEKAITFDLGYRKNLRATRFSPGKRQLLQGLSLGLLGAFWSSQRLNELWSEQEKGKVISNSLIRPPGSLPEQNFLNLCTRCGLCIEACPSNMLQPAILEAGFSGFFSPVVVARRGACVPECNTCGQVCPTGAIRALYSQEKAWAKMGTAVINQEHCLAWSFERSCLVCDEACPYGAIELKRVKGLKTEVPVVLAKRCNGCGHCEFSCPVQGESAIRILPVWEMRLEDGSYIQAGKRMGLKISRKWQEKKQKQTEVKGGNSLPPGFSD